MDINKLLQILDADVKVLRDAVECGLYGTRSLVGDQVLKIEHQIKDIKHHLTSQSSGRDNNQADVVCVGCNKFPDQCDCLFQLSRR